MNQTFWEETKREILGRKFKCLKKVGNLKKKKSLNFLKNFEVKSKDGK